MEVNVIYDGRGFVYKSAIYTEYYGHKKIKNLKIQLTELFNVQPISNDTPLKTNSELLFLCFVLV
jgi:hypothetical protein